MNTLRFSFVSALVIFAMVFFAVFAFVMQVQAATLSVSPKTDSVIVGDTFTVEILIDTEGEDTSGVDIKYLNFNPDLLEAKEVVPGTLYPATQVNQIDNTAGTINFAQVTTARGQYKGSGVLATVTFLAKSKSSKAIVSFDFELGNTVDTNIAKGGVDILESVDNGRYRIKSGKGFFQSIIEFFSNLFTSSS